MPTRPPSTPVDPDLLLLVEIRANDYLSVFDNVAAKQFGVRMYELDDLLRDHDRFEIVEKRSQRGNTFRVVRVRCTAEGLAALAPVPLEALRKAYGWGDAPALLEALEEGMAQEQFHAADGRLRPGGAPPEAVPLSAHDALAQMGVCIAGNGRRSNGPPAPFGGEAPAAYDLPPEQDDDLRVLGALEDREAERINFGLYETYVHEDEVAASLEHLGAAAVRAALERLQRHQWVLDLGEGRWRSRISETVRVLKHVKQRFRADDAATAPYLIRSIRVQFADRQRPHRSRPFDEELKTFFDAHRKGGRKWDVARRGLLDGFSAAIGRAPDQTALTGVQARALHAVGGAYAQGRGRAFVVTGNTGSGKTEAALLPLLLGAVEERLRGVEGCKILLVYPRQELAKNQLQRLCRYLAHINRTLATRRGGVHGALTAGIVFGDTPKTDKDLLEGVHRRDWSRDAWSPTGDGHALPYFTDEDGEPIELLGLSAGIGRLRANAAGFEEGGWELDGFRATREAVLRTPPDVLVITTEMLHRWLMDPAANALFGLPDVRGGAPAFCPPRAVIFDEIHLYDTIHGAQVGLLLRRLNHRLSTALRGDREDDWKRPILIGMSATIGDPRDFWSRLSGVDETYVEELSPQPEDLEAAQGREYFLFLRPETYSRGKNVGDASAAIQTIMAVAHTMRRRGPSAEDPAKFRTLVFQDSISKVKKLALEYFDAEVNKRLARLRLARPAGDPLEAPAFLDGEYWIFEADDPFQYADGRRTPGAPPAPLSANPQPVYSGGKGADLLEKDVVFATTVLEVGYDDPAIQFVLQHHAPTNPASFVQKKGRAGRALDDRPITAVTLSERSFRDAFYYQNPDLLTNPADYRPPLNPSNYFVQRFQTLALLFDELARLDGQDYRRLPSGPLSDDRIDEHLQTVQRRLEAHAAALDRAYAAVTAATFRRVHPSWRGAWTWFRDHLDDREVRLTLRGRRDLLVASPELPDNLFSTINLPTVRVMYPARPWDEGNHEFDMSEEDVALAFSEFAPGKTSRRYGRGTWVMWRPPRLWNEGFTFVHHDRVAVERYKTDRTDSEGGTLPPGPFNPDRLRTTEALWGDDWRRLVPRDVARIYGAAAPQRFYRARYLELWSFGELDRRNPRQPHESWRWWGELRPDGSVGLWQNPDDRRVNTRNLRRVDPNSNSYALSFAVARPCQNGDDSPASPHAAIPLPPLFYGLLDTLEVFAGEVAGERSALAVWEVQYGAEARIVLKKQPNRAHDPHAGLGVNLVQYVSEHDRAPTYYGYDLTTEGLRAPYSASALGEVAGEVFEEVWADPRRQAHLQDQFLRYLLKTEPWPVTGVDTPLNPYDVRTVADLVATMRAETRAQGMPLDGFLARLTSPQGCTELLQEVARTYWRDGRVFTPEFRTRLQATLTHPPVRRFLNRVFDRLTRPDDVLEFVRYTLVHSLKHAVRHLFVTEGSTRDEEVGSVGVFKGAYDDWGENEDFYVYERNQDGNGAARLVERALREGAPGRVTHRWWDVTLACPVGDEEDFIKAALDAHGDALVDFADAFFRTPPAERQSPKDLLARIYGDLLHQALPSVERLAGLVTAELGIAGRHLAQIRLLRELRCMETALAARFLRPPTPTELAGYVATRVEDEDPELPHLRELYDLYREHHATLDQGGEDANGEGETAGGDPDQRSADAPSALDRFLAQVRHLSLSTCVDACPACLADSCDIGHVDTTRHALSRRLLKAAHRALTAPFTLPYRGDLSADEVEAAAAASGGWAFCTHTGRLPADLLRGLRDRGFETVGRVFDYERQEVRWIFFQTTQTS